jgi:hypothetical protein
LCSKYTRDDESRRSIGAASEPCTSQTAAGNRTVREVSSDHVYDGLLAKGKIDVLPLTFASPAAYPPFVICSTRNGGQTPDQTINRTINQDARFRI